MAVITEVGPDLHEVEAKGATLHPGSATLSPPARSPVASDQGLRMRQAQAGHAAAQVITVLSALWHLTGPNGPAELGQAGDT